MYVAYAYRWTKVGNVVLVIMDVVDVLLPVCEHFVNPKNLIFSSSR